MTQEERRAYLINKLLNEQPAYAKFEVPHSSGEQKTLLRALLNVRMPAPADAEFLQVQDEYLEEELRCRGVTDADALPEVQPGVAIWQGDISTLRCAAKDGRADRTCAALPALRQTDEHEPACG